MTDSKFPCGVDLLTGAAVQQGETLRLDPTDVVVLREDAPGDAA